MTKHYGSIPNCMAAAAAERRQRPRPTSQGLVLAAVVDAGTQDAADIRAYLPSDLGHYKRDGNCSVPLVFFFKALTGRSARKPGVV